MPFDNPRVRLDPGEALSAGFAVPKIDSLVGIEVEHLQMVE